MSERVCSNCNESMWLWADLPEMTTCNTCYMYGIRGWHEDSVTGELVLWKPPPLEELQRDLTQLKSYLSVRESICDAKQAEYDQFMRRYSEAKDSQSGWRRFFDLEPQGFIPPNEARWGLASAERYCAEVTERIKQVESDIRDVLDDKKKAIADAQSKARQKEYKRRREERDAALAERSLSECQSDDYDRSRYRIRKKDYKRGNAVDNYCRKAFLRTILEVFENRCLYCRATTDLTLDHYGIPKNEGGNFILMRQGEESIRPNVIVLCRSCNSAKGEKRFDKFLSTDDLNLAEQFQVRLLQAILADEEMMALLRKAYRK